MGRTSNGTCSTLMALPADSTQTEPESRLWKRCERQSCSHSSGRIKAMSSTDANRTTTEMTAATSERRACCSSPSSLFYWCTVSVATWGLLSLVGVFWYPLHAVSAAAILFAAATGCFANWIKNRTFHCSITAWIFLASGAVFLLANAGLIQIEPRFVWPFVAIGTAFSFNLEWRYARRSTR
jgi:hypothetical protein